MGPNIRLDDVHSKASTSEEHIVPKHGVGKTTQYTVTYTHV